MALTHHDDISLMIGDEWLIVGKLLDEDGAPLDLLAGGTNLGWTLVGGDGDQVEGVVDAATLEPQEGGIVNIRVSDSFTRTLEPGRYFNSIRVWVGGEPATHWVGIILTEADPFHVTHVIDQSPSPSCCSRLPCGAWRSRRSSRCRLRSRTSRCRPFTVTDPDGPHRCGARQAARAGAGALPARTQSGVRLDW